VKLRPRASTRSFGVILLGLVVIGGGGWWVTNSALFQLRTLRVSGNSRVSAQDVARLGGLTEHTNVLWFSSSVVERSLERDPWILSARISRVLPSVITVTIEERVPVAILTPGRWLAAADGIVLAPAEQAGGLPEVTVAETDLHVGLRLLSPPPELTVLGSLPSGFLKNVVSVAGDSGNLTLILRSGVTVLYGDESRATEKARALQSVLNWTSRNGVKPTYVDVRAPTTPALLPAGAAIPA
jgi:cell division protein FtsQ